MPAIESLQKNLNKLNREALGVVRLGESLPLEKLNDKLRAWIKQGVSVKTPPQDRVRSAVLDFYQAKVGGFSQLRLCCFGCLQVMDMSPAGPLRYRLLDDRPRFIQLLNHVEKLDAQPRKFQWLYKPLLHAYFSFGLDNESETENARRSWLDLREFLDEHKGAIESPGINPEWIAALSEHTNLLTQNPCVRYGLAALRGDRAVFDEIRSRLEIRDDSWLVRRLVFAQVDAAIAEGDSVFKGYVDYLIQLLNEHRLHAHDGLTKVLNRYAQGKDPELHPGLRDFAVGLWGNPWLPSNRIHWQHCNDDSRELVTRWLKRHLLREFFSILSEDGAANTRRVDFWELYSEDPPGMFFALGSAALDGRNKLFKKFIDDAKGLCEKLYGGQSDLHAFIMQFSRYHVIEFSLHGNSTYFYDTKHGSPPYDLKTGWLDIGSPSKGGTGLKAGGKNPPFSTPRRHADTNAGLWEQQFAEVMGSTPASIREFCRKYGCDHVSPTRSGGNEWIMQTPRTRWDKPQWAVLFGWGFSWSDQKKGFYRAGT